MPAGRRASPWGVRIPKTGLPAIIGLVKSPPLVLAVSGASGAPYARNFLRHLVRLKVPVELVVTEAGALLIRDELGAKPTPEGCAAPCPV